MNDLLDDEARVPIVAADALEARARVVVITDAASYTAAVELLGGIKDLRRQIAGTFDDHIKRAYDAHRALCAEKRKAEGTVIRAEAFVKSALVAWEQDEERRAELERARLRALAHEAAEEETIEAAAAAEAEGDYARAQHILDLPPPVPISVVEAHIPHVEGLAFRDTWSAEVEDFAALVKAAAEHPQWLALVKPDQAALNGMARSLRGRLAVPGVRAVRTRNVAARR